MGYVFAFATVLCGITKGFCGKKISKYTAQPYHAAVFTCIRMLLCCAVGFLLVLAEGSTLRVSWKVLLIAAASGTATAVFSICWLMAVRKNVYALVDMFCTLSILIPLVCAWVFYGETMGGFDFLGLTLLLVSAWIFGSYNATEKQKLRPADLLLLLLLNISLGTSSFLQKVFSCSEGSGSAAVYNFYTYLFAAGALTVYLFFAAKRSSADAEPPKTVWLQVGIMALCLFGSSFFSTCAASFLRAAQLYPLTQGASLILSAGMAAVFFGEKITVRVIVGCVTCFVGLLLLNLL